MTTCWLVGIPAGVGVGVGVGEEGGLEEIAALPPQLPIMSDTRTRHAVRKIERCLEFAVELIGAAYHLAGWVF
jgi:hypothetical protein